MNKKPNKTALPKGREKENFSHDEQAFCDQQQLRAYSLSISNLK